MNDFLISCLDDRLGDAATRRFFRPEEANHPTRITAKALTLELLTEGPRSLRRLLKDLEEDYPAAQLQWNLGDFTRYCTLTKLWSDLFTWARSQGMAKGQRPSSWTPRGRLWQAVAKHIDWNWIVRRLQKEIVQHGNRAGRRALELQMGMPYEHIEMAAEQ